MSAVLFAFLILAGLGILLGVGLAFADKKFSVEKDEKLVALEEIMPGANCGGCGYAGCSAYAEAVYNGEAKPGLCLPGGLELANKMGSILGVEVEMKEKTVAYVFCNADCESTKTDYKYYGLSDCNAASILFKGKNSCKYGCLGFGSCIKVCDSGAISKNEKGQVVVDPDLCIGCGKCASVCPNGVIKLIPATATYVCSCNNKDKGAVTRKVCESGCIGCKICEVKFPKSGFKVVDNLSVSDYSAPEEKAAEAAAACPRKIIIKR